MKTNTNLHRIFATVVLAAFNLVSGWAVDWAYINWDENTKTISMSCSTAGATIYYTVDGTTPTTSSYKYTAPFVVNRNLAIRSIAVKGDEVSNVYDKNVSVDSRVQVGTIFYRRVDNTLDNVVEVCSPLTGSYEGDIIIQPSITLANVTYQVTRIGNGAFYNNKNITSVTIPNTVTTIGNQAFYSCDNLTSISLPQSVKKIEYNAFRECSNLKSITLNNGLETIGYGVFYNCRRLQNVTLPSTLKTIEYDAFEYCTSFTRMELPDGLTDIGHSLFEDCSNLASVKLPATMTAIPEHMFWASGIKSIDIPSTVKSIGENAFRNCDALTSIVIPDGVETLGNYVFCDCNNLLSATIGEGVTTIPYCAFDDDYALSVVSLPSTLTAIGERAFNTCGSLTSITIPENVTSIARYAFTECDKLTSIYSLPLTPPAMGSGNDNPFYDAVARATLYVKSTAMPAYQSSEQWDIFQNKSSFDQQACAQPTFALADYVLTMSTTTVGATIYYTLDGTNPTTASTEYTAPIPFLQNGTVKAIAVKDGMDNSNVSEFVKSNYQVPAPVATMDENFVVTLSCESPQIDGFPETKFYYVINTDYSNYSVEQYPNWGWQLWDGQPIQLDQPRYVHVYAERDGWVRSLPQTYNFYSAYKTDAPSIEWNSSTSKAYIYNYEGYFANCTLYYTLDGSDPTDPTTERYVYNPADSIPLIRDVFIRCVATQPGHFNSTISYKEITGVAKSFWVAPFYYRLRDNMTADEVEVTHDKNPYSGDLVVPSTVEYSGKTYQVTRIGNDAFSDDDYVTGVKLPESINSIGTYAFNDCDRLTKIDIPASVKSIEYRAFYSCDKLKEVTLHEGLETIGDEAFYNNYQLSIITLPSTLKTIGIRSFRACTSLTSIAIPNSVTTMGEDVFNDCTALTTVTLSNQLTALPKNVFYNTALRSIEIPASVQTIGDYAFQGCKSLVSVIFPATMTSLGNRTFQGCTSLASISIPEGVTRLEEAAVADCYALTTVTLPSTLTYIGKWAFSGSTALTSITIPENVKTIEQNAFTSSPLLTSIYSLPMTPPTLNGDVSNHAFADATTRATIYVKPAAESNYRVASHWNEFTHVKTFENALCAQPTFVLNNYQLSIATATNGATIYYTTDGTDPTTSSTAYSAPINFWQNGTVKAIAVKEGMDNSLVAEFKKENLTVAIPVATIDETFKVTITCEQPAIEGFPQPRIYYLFNESYSDVDLSDSRWQLYDGEPIQLTQPKFVHVYAERDGWITSPQAYANFYNPYYTRHPDMYWHAEKRKLELYNYDADATVYYTLDGTDPTEQSLIYNPADSIAIARNVLVKCIAMRSGHFNSIINQYQITGVNQTFAKDGIYYRIVDNSLANEVEVTHGDKRYEDDIVIPESIKYAGVDYEVTRIGEYAFAENYYGYSKITSVTIPSTVRSIGYSAFDYADKLTEIDVPASVTTLERAAFYCTGLKKVTLHEGLETMGIRAFYGNGQLSDITLPQTVKSIGFEAFYDCNQLTKIVIPENVTTIGYSAFAECDKLESVTLPPGLTELAEKLFQNTPLKSIVIPAGVTTIGNRAFYQCRSLNSVTIPASVQTIGNEVFQYCSSLTSISIPEGVTAIGEYLFDGCSLLTTVQLPASLTTIARYAFRDCATMPTVTLPENLKTIDTYAFHGCSALTSVYSLAATPPTLNGDGNTNAFASVLGKATLYVKTDAKEKYDNANIWSSFSSTSSFEDVPCAQPTFTLTNFRLAMKSNTEGVTIYYTTDDSDPTTQSMKYTEPILLLQNDTIRAIAVADGFAPSLVSDFRKADYKVDVPTASLSDDLVLTISYKEPIEGLAPTRLYYQQGSWSDATYGYWNDKPWTLYEAPVQMTEPCYVRVKAERDGWLTSDNSSSYNYYTDYRLDAPQMKWEKDATTGIGTITLSYYNENSKGDFYYTLDGTDPTKDNGTLYTEPFEVIRNLTVKAVAVMDKHFNSTITTREITDVNRTFYVNKVWYRLTDNSLANEVEVTNGNISYEGDVTVPEKVLIQGDSYDVVGVGERAFYDQDKMNSVSLPASITYIGNNAFYDSDNLLAIDVPEKVKTIGNSAFHSCDRLATVTLHEGLENIGNSAFNYLPGLKTIVMPSTLTTIGNAAFANCTSLTSATMPASMTAIPDEIFYQDRQLADITLPTAFVTVGNRAFAQTAITTMQLPTTVKEFGVGAFSNCSQLTNMVIPESVTELSTSLFEGCSVLTSVSLPSTLEKIANRSFYNCPSLESVVLPATIKTIGAGAFNSCSKLMSVYSLATTPGTIEGNPDSWYGYDKDAFYDIKLTATLYVPETAVDAYKEKARWQEFTNIVGSTLLPCQQPTFELADFKLTMKSLTEGAMIYYTNDNSTPDANAIPYTAPITLAHNDTILAVAIKDGMAASPVARFAKNDYKVAVPVATMSDDFLVTITCETPDVDGLPETTIYYKERTSDGYWEDSYGEWKLYEGPVQLTQPRFIRVMAKRDKWLDSDESNTYNYYTNYRLEKPQIAWSSENKKFTITNNNADAKVYYTLDGTTPTAENGTLYTEPVSLIRNLKIKAVAVQDAHFNSEVDSVKVDGVNFQFMADGLYYRLLDYTLDNVVELVCPSGVTYSGDITLNSTVSYEGVDYTLTGIAESVFSGSSELTSIKLPSTLQNIGNYAFYNCTKLEEIEIPALVKKIPYQAFYGSNNLKTVVLHDGLETIDGYAFYQCSNLQEMIIPNTVKAIGEYAFRNCYKLEKVVLPALLEEIPRYAFAETAIMGIDIPSTVKRIGEYAFSTCRKLSSVALPEGITSIENNTFANCESMTTIELPSTLKTIGDYAFYQAKSLLNIILPATVNSIGYRAFVGCSAMERIYALPLAPPALNERPFDGITTTATLYVLEDPADVEEKYHSAAHWGDFTHIETFKDIPCAQPTFAYDNFTLSMQSKTAGVSIFFTTDGTEPTVNSIPYVEPIALLKNDTIRAMAIGEGWGQSMTSVFRKNDFKVDAPTASINTDFVVTLNCEAPEVMGLPETKIYYSQNRSSYDAGEEWTLYQEPFKMLTAGYIHVKAVRDGWLESDIIHNNYYSDYYLEKPTISYVTADTIITLSHSQENAQLYYSLDGSDPNENGVLYTAPIKPQHNVNVVVIAKREGAINSDPAQREFKWFTIPTPVITIEHLAAVMKVEKPDYAKIYYTLDNSTPTAESTLYTEPVAMSKDCKIKAIAIADNWNNSSVGTFNSLTGFVRKDYTVATPTFGTRQVTDGVMKENADSVLTITTATEGATIYYTLDGSTPTVNSLKYENGIKMTENCTVKAYAVKEDLFDSEAIEAAVEWLTVKQPHIQFNGKYVEMWDDTEDAVIYYTIDGTDPDTKSKVYQKPFALDAEEISVRAIAVKENWNTSEVSRLTYNPGKNYCETPGITRVAGTNKVQMTTRTQGAKIYFTNDGLNPTISSSLYNAETGLEVTENCTLKAMAVDSLLYDSEVTTFVVDWFKADQPVITVDGIFVTITAPKENSRVYYTLDGSEPTTESTLYEGTLTMKGSGTIKAIAAFDNFNNSSVAVFNYYASDYTCGLPTFTRDGNTVSIASAPAEGTTIYYTLDGTTPTTASSVFTEPIAVDHNITIKAMAMNNKLFTSEVADYEVNWFTTDAPVIAFDGIFATMTCTTPNSRIYYTLDGSTPTAESFLFTSAVTMTASCTVKAIAVRDNFNNSAVTSMSFDKASNTVSTPQFTKNDNAVSIMVTQTEGTTIYYTLDGTTPTTASAIYTEPVQMTENCTLKVLAMNDKLFTSEVAEYEVNWFKVETPVIAFDGIFATMTCATPNSRIYYTLDGTSPTAESFLFTSAVTMTASCTVKAIAIRDNFNNSAVTSVSFDKASNTVAMPQFKRNGNLITITTTTETEGTTIYYTVDGSDPTAESAVYSEPVQMVENCTLKAVALNEKLFTSEISSFNIDWFKVETPVLAISGNTLTMSCATPGAVIYYEYDDVPTLKSAVYNGPITLVDNRSVFAIAVKMNFNDSEMAGANPDIFVCTEPTFAYNGRYLQVETGEGMTIHYTTDGSKPTEDSEVYTGQIEIENVCTVRAIATRKDFRDSPESSYTVTYVYTGEGASQSEAGHLKEMFQWIGTTENVENLPVSGKVNADDLEFIRGIKSLRHLDMTEATYEGTALPDEAFAGMDLISFQSPKQLNSVGEHLFRGCNKLAAIVWNANIAIPESVTDDVKSNANFLLYVNSRIHVPSSYTGNVISGGQATSITLSDAGSGNFCCPQRFYTQRISYTHTYSQKTESGVTCGWETLALPFDVQSITHERRGSLAPFSAQEDYSLYKPFWLYELEETGFSDATEIKAYTPYIISMPNNPKYADDFILAGKVTFSAADTYIEADTAMVTMKGSVRFAPAMQRQEKSSSVLAINLEDCEVDGVFYRSGSAFLPNLRTVNPFEAYALVGTSILKMPLADMNWGYVTDIRNAQMSELEAIGRKGGVYDLLGRKLSNDSSHLKSNGKKHKRVYIINGKKTVVE